MSLQGSINKGFQFIALAFLVLAFQNCGKIATDTAVTGEMTQHIAVDLPPLPTLQSMITSYYQMFVGRAPSSTELATAVSGFQNGQSFDGLTFAEFEKLLGL